MGCCRTAELRHKEVINSLDGCRLGTVDDIEIDTVTAKLISVIIYGRPRFFGIFGRSDDLVINWENIELIGEDTIIVNSAPRKHTRRSGRALFPFLTGF